MIQESVSKVGDVICVTQPYIANATGESKGGDEFWVKAEKLLYQALIGYIYYEAPPHEQNMNSLVEMINKMEVREDNENFKNAVDYTLEALEERAPQHFAVRQYKKYKLAAGVVLL
jgi:type IV secretion system protein VirD4